jgi:hypothetical protein
MTEQLYDYLHIRCDICGDTFELVCDYYDHGETGLNESFKPGELAGWVEEHKESCDAWHSSSVFRVPSKFSLSHEGDKLP